MLQFSTNTIYRHFSRIAALSGVKQLLFGSFPTAAEWLLLGFLLFPKKGNHSHTPKGRGPVRWVPVGGAWWPGTPNLPGPADPKESGSTSGLWSSWAVTPRIKALATFLRPGQGVDPRGPWAAGPPCQHCPTSQLAGGWWGPWGLLSLNQSHLPVLLTDVLPLPSPGHPPRPLQGPPCPLGLQWVSMAF